MNIVIVTGSNGLIGMHDILKLNDNLDIKSNLLKLYNAPEDWLMKKIKFKDLKNYFINKN